MVPLHRLALVLALLLLSAAGSTQQKAYAPENLRQLTVPDRVRVIEREYSDQSGGRLIPDDQLTFYLDQIDSGWGFSEIKRDIASSLRGSAWRPSNSNWQPRSVTCSSIDGRYTECVTSFHGQATLQHQLSRANCIEGRTWGQRRGVIWVDDGCRGQFSERHDASQGSWTGAPYHDGGSFVVCESRQGKRRRCATSLRGPIILIEQYSNAECIEGDSWGWQPGEIWVRRGCRGKFAEARGGRPGLPVGGGRPGYGDAGYSVTCASEDGRHRTCAWQSRQGRPILVEQISRASCVEGRSWGFDGYQIWVDQGCRARFAPR
ncbi:DUF3011 domain-containing protein [Pseudomarimonas arenosa]|uniref:DUF3011 domain-containing protein n=1 Tax=Pseudomarimonas arenosa TaxID=2774145 RepID=A0AAW3ZDQ6_9GAMM|nr:DUF3011 domain-containing protein [Pseudomarimonas arenosa]MBD8524168.1 DUF3011 domain-containing protein [Pseudomarimonas arenosa]